MAVAPSIGIYLYKAVGNFIILFWIALFVAGGALLIASTIRLHTKRPAAKKQKLSIDLFFLIRAWLTAINIALFSFCFGVLSNYLAIYSR